MDIMSLLDGVSQVVICIFGIGSIFMISCLKNRWGNVVAIFCQPFWFFTTIYNKQWGMVILTVAYTIIWALGIYKWFWKNKNPS